MKGRIENRVGSLLLRVGVLIGWAVVSGAGCIPEEESPGGGDGYGDRSTTAQAEPADPPGPCASSVSTFDVSDEGWRVQAVDHSDMIAPFWDARGYISVVANQRYRWVAPQRFLGNKSCLYGRNLSFQMVGNLAARMNSGGRVVTLSGRDIQIAYDLPFTTRGGLVGISIRLDESEAWYNTSSGQRATGAEVVAVLSEITRLDIEANSLAGGGTLLLDNVALGEPFADPPSGPVEIRFADGNEGWLAQRWDGSITPPVDATWNPDGFIQFAGDDGTGALRWIAPRSVMGDRSGLYDGTLSFDVTGVIDRGDSRVTIAGGGHMLYCPAQVTQRAEPAHVSIRLSESDQWYDPGTGQRASRQQIQEVLSELTSLVIFGKVEDLYHTPSDFALDNVLMLAP
jgi:hypothetical protein